MSFFPHNMSWGKITERVSESWSQLQLGKSIVNTIVLSFGLLGCQNRRVRIRRIRFVKDEA